MQHVQDYLEMACVTGASGADSYFVQTYLLFSVPVLITLYVGSIAAVLWTLRRLSRFEGAALYTKPLRQTCLNVRHP
jgi:hypothetical protein